VLIVICDNTPEVVCKLMEEEISTVFVTDVIYKSDLDGM
jgi:hypothetical protein